MIDIHTHVIYDIDDGSDTLEESVAILQYVFNAGITDVICTPHYTGSDKMSYNNDGVKEKFEILKNTLQNRGIGINIYLGNEVAVYGNIIQILEEKIAMNLANSRYMLIEFPRQTEVNYVLETIYEMRIRGCIPIVAHPERCLCFQREYSLVKKLIDEGAYIQTNVGSVYGYYGKTSKKISRKLLREGLVHFIATDIHSLQNNKYTHVNEMLCNIGKKIGKDKVLELTEINPRKVIQNEKI